jgi:hypothetical protein
VDHTRAVPFGDVNRAIAGTIVGNHYFACDSRCLEGG